MRSKRTSLTAVATVVLAASLVVSLGWIGLGDTGHEHPSCATFLMHAADALLVGHNLDDNIEVPGMIVVNPRGIAKENISWDDLKSVFGRSGSEPRLRWVSKYGSITYNAMGREFPDGGVNEAGFYVGEMTLMGTRYPEGSKPRFYHNQWMQYLLDNFATVEDVLANLSSAFPAGHCQWHFFLADRSGRAAVIEFLRGTTVVHTGATLPYPILCNDAYGSELEDLGNYAGFGGAKKPEPCYKREDPRFRWAAVMLRDYDRTSPSVAYAFSILKRLDTGNNKWSIVYDMTAQRMFVHTYKARRVRSLSFATFDFSCGAGPKVLEIHADLEGDISGRFAPATDATNGQNVRAFWSGVDMGFLGNNILKPILVTRMSEYPRAFACAR